MNKCREISRQTTLLLLHKLIPGNLQIRKSCNLCLRGQFNKLTLAFLLKIMCSLLLILPNSLMRFLSNLMKVQPTCQNQKGSNQWMKQNLRTFKTITTNRRPLNKTQDGELNYSKVCYILHFAHTNKNTMVTQFCMILIWIFVHQNRNKWVIFS